MIGALKARFLEEPYSYQDIAPHDNGRSPFIQLLVLQPEKSPSDPLFATLTQVSLEAADGKFEALSYTWGEKIFLNNIIVDGKVREITKNLHQCLLRFRGKKPRSLWVDALCINQADPDERTAQVAIMGRIYSSAKCTLSWIGEPQNTDEAGVTFDFFRREASRFRSNGPSNDREANYKAMYWARCEEARWDQRDENLPLVSKESVDMLMEAEYFKRRWIIQEILLSRAAQLIWGPHILPWEDFEIVIEQLIFSPGPARSLAEKPWMSPVPGLSNILGLMEAFEPTECEDARDRIAALQELWRGHEKDMRSFSVDYAQSLQSNYIQFARCLAQTPNLGQLLLYAARSNLWRIVGRTDDVLEMPTWMPDWRCSQFPEGLSSQTIAYPSTLGDNNELILRGWIVDTITNVSGWSQVELETASGRRRCFRMGAKPITRPGDKIITLAHGEILDVPQFVIRETEAEIGKYQLIAECDWNWEMRLLRFSSEEQWTYADDAVEIVLV